MNGCHLVSIFNLQITFSSLHMNQAQSTSKKFLGCPIAFVSWFELTSCLCFCLKFNSFKYQTFVLLPDARTWSTAPYGPRERAPSSAGWPHPFPPVSMYPESTTDSPARLSLRQTGSPGMIYRWVNTKEIKHLRAAVRDQQPQPQNTL